MNDDANEDNDDNYRTKIIRNILIYIPVVTLSLKNNIKFLENIKQGFRKTISWNKYGSHILTQPKARV